MGPLISFRTQFHLSHSHIYLEHNRCIELFEKTKQRYKSDKRFQKYVYENYQATKNKIYPFNDLQIEFYLEEHLIAMVITKGDLELQNKFINDQEKWILLCYRGKPLKAHMYLHQINPFKLKNVKNTYEDSWYNLEEKNCMTFCVST